jgi:hypothetical protein
VESQTLHPPQVRRPGRPEAAALCFDWQSSGAVAEESGTEAMAARKRGIKQVAITASLAALLYFFFSEHVGTIVAGVAGVLLVSSMLFPLSVYAWIESTVGWIATTLQKAVTWLLMLVIFGVIFAPFGYLFRRGKHDKLKRWMEPESDSYWNDRTEQITAESRLRLY